MIVKDFHLTKAFRQIRGKAFVIMVGVLIRAGLSAHTGQVSLLGDRHDRFVNLAALHDRGSSGQWRLKARQFARVCRRVFLAIFIID
jgi:hypothetical protein